jgi:PAS domain S-box-containing protein
MKKLLLHKKLILGLLSLGGIATLVNAAIQFWFGYHPLIGFIIDSLVILSLAIIAGIYFDRMVTCHIRKTSKYLETLPEHFGENSFQLQRNSQHWDELDDLTQTVNQLNIKLAECSREILEEKNRYFALVDENPEAIWRCELNHPLSVTNAEDQQINTLQNHAIIAEVNQATLNLIHDINPDELIGKSWQNLPFLQPLLWQELIRGQYKLKDWISQCTDNHGIEHFFSNSLTCVIVEGEIKSIWGIAVDITQQIKIQRELEDREQKLRSSQDSLSEAQSLAHMGHWSFNAADNQIHASDEFARIYGFDAVPQNLTWHDLKMRIHPEDRAHIIEGLTLPVNSSAAEHRIIWPNKEIRYVQAMARKTVEHNRVIRILGIIIDITDRKRAEHAQHQSKMALIESEARMAEAQAIAHLGHWIFDHQKQTFSCSDEFFRLFGHPPQSFAPSLRDFYRQIHPEDQQRIRILFNNLRERTLTHEYRIIRADGSLRYMRGTMKSFYTGGRETQRVFGISMDITEQKLTELELRNSQELFSKAFAASPDAIAFIDLQGQTLVDVNQTLANIAQLSQQDLVELTLVEFADQMGCPELPKLFDNPSVQDNIEVRLRPNITSESTYLLSWRLVELMGKSRILAILRDVTALRELQQMADQQQKQLVRADKLASLGTMVAGVAHEINNPNHLIQMNAELLEGFTVYLLALLREQMGESVNLQFNGMPLSEITAAVPELLADIKSSSRRINRIVKDLKDFSRPRDNAEFLPLDFNNIIDNARTLLGSALAKRSVTLNYDLTADLPTIWGDSERLEQVIVNLVTNAFDATDAADIANARINIRTYRFNEQFVACEVSDNGMGISPENLKHIFDPFFTTKQEQGGTGLGLSISYRLIREHSGHLEVISPGVGTTMRILLPIFNVDTTLVKLSTT